eukprot:1159177-Pelagomonas_calceolata.AAC.2
MAEAHLPPPLSLESYKYGTQNAALASSPLVWPYNTQGLGCLGRHLASLHATVSILIRNESQARKPRGLPATAWMRKRKVCASQEAACIKEKFPS